MEVTVRKEQPSNLKKPKRRKHIKGGTGRSNITQLNRQGQYYRIKIITAKFAISRVNKNLKAIHEIISLA